MKSTLGAGVVVSCWFKEGVHDWIVVDELVLGYGQPGSCLGHNLLVVLYFRIPIGPIRVRLNEYGLYPYVCRNLGVPRQ
jgi:hypothetical protein